MSLFTKHGRRVLICVHGDCAEPEQGKRLERRLARLITDHGLDEATHPQYTYCTITNCLGICENGPIMVVHPDGVKYHKLTEDTLERIFNEHLLGNRPVEELIIQRF